jgi:EPS-associated MarR family transcriptional regulator
MNNNIDMKKINQQQFDVLRKISKKPSANQRELASDLEISLGKLNFVLKGLKKNGLIKIRNFKKNPNKSRYLYLLTPKGIAEKTDLTINFMKRKMEEYDELREELKKGKNVCNNKI